jgi:pimeloyl-ACP methyl ester carboxylesterase/DNA-binding winged helix-turn-helix (wHTH) protein
MRYAFLDCEIDTETHELRSGGVLRRVEPQVFDLLRLLVENPNRLITRDEMIDAVWGGRIVSEATISSRINAARVAVGDDGTRQAVIKTVPRRGIRFIAPVRSEVESQTAAEMREDGADRPCPEPAESFEQVQKVRFCRARDGTRIAFATFGSGPPLVRVGHWLSHLEHDWHSPIWRPFLSELGKSFTVVRYDQRGNGLSDRDVDDLSLEAFVSDLETVVDAAGIDRFAIYASSQGVPVALEYAARHPARLSCLSLHGGFVKGRLLRSQAEREQGEAYLALMRHGWGAEGSQFLQAFGSIYVPDGTPEQLRSLVELQRISATAETAVRLREAFDRFDVTHRLSAIEVPTLVLHGRNDGVHPLQQSLEMTAVLPDAELVVLETRNHIMVGHDPAWHEFFAALRRFVLARSRTPSPRKGERWGGD